MLYRTLTRRSQSGSPTVSRLRSDSAPSKRGRDSGNIAWLQGYQTHRCPVCSSPGAHSLLLSVRSAIAPHEPVLFVRCRECDVRFVLDYRSVSYAESAPNRASLNFYVEQGAGVEFLAHSLFAAAQIPVRSYLDLGCGFGFGLDMATRIFGWNARGIDPGSLAAVGRDMLGVTIDGEILVPGHPRAEGPFDAISAMEVIEHLTDPHSFLRSVRENLSADGIFVLSTPNGRYLDAFPAGDMLLPVLSPGFHAILYTAETLTSVLNRAGFQSVCITENPTTLFAVAATSSARTLVPRAAFDPARYAAYLRSRFRDSPKDSPLHVGFGQRLVRRLTQDGLHEEALAVLDEIRAALLSRFALDLNRPLEIAAQISQASPAFEDVPSTYPFCLGGLLYSKGIIIAGSEENEDQAAHYLLAARVAAEATLKALNAAGISDDDMVTVKALAADGLKSLW